MGVPPKYDWAAIRTMFVAGKTAREWSLIFKANADHILHRSKAEQWGVLRRLVRTTGLPQVTSVISQKPEKGLADMTVTPKEVGFETEKPVSINADKNADTIERALRLRSSEEFRNRVINQADKALTTLEKAVVNNVFETDRFAEALTKVERIGARAYGYDRESDHPIVNIGILGSGSEYDPI